MRLQSNTQILLYGISCGSAAADPLPPIRKERSRGRADEGRSLDLLIAATGRLVATVEIGRFKGLGEMMAHQLKETTMDPRKRTLLKVTLMADDAEADSSVERLMGNKAESRFAFIQERAEFATEELLDV